MNKSKRNMKFLFQLFFIFLGVFSFTNPVISDNSQEIAAIKSEVKEKFEIELKDGEKANWSPGQLKSVRDALKGLPPSFLKATKTIQRSPSAYSRGPLGYVYPDAPVVYLTDQSIIYRVSTATISSLDDKSPERAFQGVMIHEMAHTFHNLHPELLQSWESTFWFDNSLFKSLKTPSVSSYGNSQPVEDLAESVRAYWLKGEWMKKNFPERYEFVKTNIMEGKEFPQASIDPENDEILREEKTEGLKLEIGDLQIEIDLLNQFISKVRSEISEIQKKADAPKRLSEGKGSIWEVIKFFFSPSAKKYYKDLLASQDAKEKELKRLLAQVESFSQKLNQKKAAQGAAKKIQLELNTDY